MRPTATCSRTSPTSSPARPGWSSRCRRTGTVRVAVSPDGTPDHWIVDVACRDADGLLAHLAEALTATGCDIAAATVATWPDGAVVDTFLVRAAVRPPARRLADADGGGARRAARPGAARRPSTSQFDNDVAAVAHVVHGHRSRPPGHARRTRRAPSRPPACRCTRRVLTSVDGQLVDRFALTDRLGRKLDARTTTRVGDVLAGRAPRRRARQLIRSCVPVAASHQNATQPKHPCAVAETLDPLNCRTDRPGRASRSTDLEPGRADA